MPNEPKAYDFGSSDGLLRFFQERSEDIAKVVIPQGPVYWTIDGVRTPRPMPDCGMIIYMQAENHYITRHDAEVILNDGILNRMKIRIQIGLDH